MQKGETGKWETFQGRVLVLFEDFNRHLILLYRNLFTYKLSKLNKFIGQNVIVPYNMHAEEIKSI